MTLVEIRDVFILVLAGTGILTLFTFLVLAVLLYGKIAAALDSAGGILGNVLRTSALVSTNVASPVIRIISVLKGIRQGAHMFSRLSKREKGVDDNGK